VYPFELVLPNATSPIVVRCGPSEPVGTTTVSLFGRPFKPYNVAYLCAIYAFRTTPHFTPRLPSTYTFRIHSLGTSYGYAVTRCITRTCRILPCTLSHSLSAPPTRRLPQRGVRVPIMSIKYLDSIPYDTTAFLWLDTTQVHTHTAHTPYDLLVATQAFVAQRRRFNIV